jgi:hypothetical protein
MLKSLINKLKFQDYLVGLALVILLYYGIALIGSGLLINEAIYYQDLGVVITSSSWVPLVRMVNILLDVQVFSQVGIYQVFAAMLLLIKSFSIIDIVFLTVTLIVVYFYLFSNISSKFFIYGFYLTSGFFMILTLLLLTSIIAAINSLLFSLIRPLTIAGVFGNIYLALGIIILLVIGSFISFASYKFYKSINKFENQAKS